MLRDGSGSSTTMKSPLSNMLKLWLARQIQIFKCHQTLLPRPGATHKQYRMNHLLAIAKQAPTLYLNQPPCLRMTATNQSGQTLGMSSGMTVTVAVWLPANPPPCIGCYHNKKTHWLTPQSPATT